MAKNSLKSVCLIIPTIKAGGAERVMTQLANFFADEKKINTHLVLLIKSERFYEVSDSVVIHEPDFDYKEFNRIVFTTKILSYLRKTLKELRPACALSFGGRYNSFVLLAAKGLNIRVFISERSQPGISYGGFIDTINKRLYKKAAGIIAQTSVAKDEIYKQTGHGNIEVIGNPIRTINGTPGENRIILNVGRFIPSKNQKSLVDIFHRIDPKDWKLIFVGDGPTMEDVQSRVNQLGLKDRVQFLSRQTDVDQYYKRAEIFAFTSRSEGFPNALAEAMNTPLACISYDCKAGPSDLIENGENGFLVPMDNTKEFENKLNLLLSDKEMRSKFKKAAKDTMEAFTVNRIGGRFHDFMHSNVQI